MLKDMVFAVVVPLATSCATIDYVGETYQPTSHVDLFFSEADVARDYKVIGQVNATGDQFVTAAGLHHKMMDRARQIGADAVIILEIGKRKLLDQKDVVETTTKTKDAVGVTIKKTTSVSDPSAEGAVIKALFVRYR